MEHRREATSSTTWFEQVTAVLYPTRVVLFVDSAASAQTALALLSNVSNVSAVRSETESPDTSFGQWCDGTTFVLAGRTQLPERTLTLFQPTNRR